jgi:hypothetical protein
MSFSYNLGANPAIDYPRLLVSDTQIENHIFEDEEIQAATQIQQLFFQSGMFYSGAGPTGGNVIGTFTFPNPPTSYLRVAAFLLNALAANKSRLASIKQMLDVKLDSSDAAIQCRATAQMYLDMDDNSGAFVIIEQVHDYQTYQERFWKQVQRQTAPS